MKYLYIVEDMQMYKSNREPDSDDAHSIDEGVLTVVDMTTGKQLNSKGEWEEIDPLEV